MNDKTDIKITGKLKSLPLTDEEKKRIFKLQTDLKEYQDKLNKRYKRDKARERNDRARAISILGACVLKLGADFWEGGNPKSFNDLLKLVGERDCNFLIDFLERNLGIKLPAPVKVVNKELETIV